MSADFSYTRLLRLQDTHTGHLVHNYCIQTDIHADQHSLGRFSYTRQIGVRFVYYYLRIPGVISAFILIKPVFCESPPEEARVAGLVESRKNKRKQKQSNFILSFSALLR